MTQAARSGKQNIVEGSVISSTFGETKIKLTNVARASLEELRRVKRDHAGRGEFEPYSADGGVVTR